VTAIATPGRRRTPTGRRAGTAAAAALAAALAIVLGAPLSSPAGAAPTSAPAVPFGNPVADDMALVSQEFNLDVDSELDITVALPAGVEAADLGPDTDLVVSSHRLVTDRPAFLEAINGTLPRVEDTFDIPFDPAAASALYAMPTSETLMLRIPTESADRTSAALQMAQAGIHPIVIELRIGTRRYSTTTFVNRLPAPGEPGTGEGRSMSVGLIIGQTTPPSIDSTATVQAGRAEIAELGRLADALAAADASPASVGLDPATLPPRAVGVEPSTLAALSTEVPELAARLAPLIAAGDVIARPRLPLDPGAAAGVDAAGAAEPLYTRWLREGEDLLDQLLPSTVVDRSIEVVDRPLSDAGAVLRRNLGTRMLVMPFDVFTATEGNTGLFTDTTQLVTVGLSDGSTLPTAVIDPYIGERLDGGAGTPLATSIDVVADLVVMAQEIRESGGVVSRHGMVLGLSDLGVPDPTLLGNLTGLLLTTPGLRLIDPSDIGSVVDRWLIDGRPVQLTLPTSPSVDLTERFALIDRVTADVDAYSSMLADDDATAARWRSVLDTLPTTAIDDQQAADMAAVLDADFVAYRDAVRVDASDFTLTGRSSQVRFAVENTSDTPLTVRVSLSSPKIRFPQGDRTETLAPGTVTDVTVDAVALSNGTSSVFLRVYTPNADVSLVPEVVLTARVTSFAGAGQLVTGAALLLVLTWWVRHWREARRKQLAAQNIGRHPAGAAAERRAVGASDELAPDAAASSLPPS
jgi:hypothetical protein